MKKSYLNNWKFMVMTFALAIGIGTLPLNSQAQQNAPLFAVVDFMKVEPGNHNAYLEMARDFWKPVQQERINQGKLMGWIFYRIRYTGANDEYNYATVNVYANRENMEHPYEDVDFEKIHPGKDISEMFAKNRAARKLVKSQLIRRANYVYPEGSPGPAPHKYIVVNYMKSKPGGGFLQYAEELTKPTARILVDDGNWAGWTLWGTMFPRGTNEPADFVSVDYYTDFSSLGNTPFMQASDKAHPDLKRSEIQERMISARTIVRSELWEVLDVVFME